MLLGCASLQVVELQASFIEENLLSQAYHRRKAAMTIRMVLHCTDKIHIPSGGSADARTELPGLGGFLIEERKPLCAVAQQAASMLRSMDNWSQSFVLMQQIRISSPLSVHEFHRQHLAHEHRSACFVLGRDTAPV